MFARCKYPPLETRDMGKKWMREKKQDYYYRKAKKDDYRARSAFKLKQIHEKFGVFSEGAVVVDLGCAPGGWLQVAQEFVGESGVVAGMDLDGIKPIEGAFFVKGDITKDSDITLLLAGLSEMFEKDRGDKPVDVLLSDMSPNITGNYSMDHACSMYLCEQALEFACQVLTPGGNFVIKVFEGDMFKAYLDRLKKCFSAVKPHTPPASRKQSSEIYIVAKGFKGC